MRYIALTLLVALTGGCDDEPAADAGFGDIGPPHPDALVLDAMTPDAALADVGLVVDLGPRLDALVMDAALMDATRDAAPVEADATVDGGGPIEPITCPIEDFEACGGDLAGPWSLVGFCTPEGSPSDPMPCEGPGEDLATCQPPPNERTCRILYGGDAIFGAGQIQARFGVGFAVHYVMDDACLMALDPGTSAADACAGIGNDRLGCVYTESQCICDATSPFESEDQVEPYEAADGRITVRGAPGGYCVQGDRLTIHFDGLGPEGWKTWLLERPGAE